MKQMTKQIVANMKRLGSSRGAHLAAIVVAAAPALAKNKAGQGRPLSHGLSATRAAIITHFNIYAPSAGSRGTSCLG